MPSILKSINKVSNNLKPPVVTKNPIKLSILVLTVPRRLEVFYVKLMKELIKQTEGKDDVEVLTLFDNKQRTVGQKRNDILNLAQGEYVVFIDDDDRIAEDYVSSILDCLYKNPDVDCVGFYGVLKKNDDPEIIGKFTMDYRKVNEYIYENNIKLLTNMPCHICVYRSVIAKKYKFPSQNFGEDSAWAIQTYNDIKQMITIPKILYYYDAMYAYTSETSGISSDTIKQNISNLLKNETLGS